MKIAELVRKLDYHLNTLSGAFITDQDKILTDFWKEFGVDSLTGNWDYKESFLFGVIAGKVVESFYNFHLNDTDKVVVQFHEWQTGAGALYLRHSGIPVATVEHTVLYIQLIILAYSTCWYATGEILKDRA